jgi:hypothetical protein
MGRAGGGGERRKKKENTNNGQDLKCTFKYLWSLSLFIGVKHEKKNFFGIGIGIEFDLLGNCIFKE